MLLSPYSNFRVVALAVTLVISPWLASHPAWAEAEAQTRDYDYMQTAYATARFAATFAVLVGLATAQSFVQEQVASAPVLGRAVNYVFTPLTLSFSILALTPLQSWIGKYIHGFFAPPESIKDRALPENELESLWFRTYQAYSMNAQMSRNVVLALNTLTFFYLDRIQRYLVSEQLEDALMTQVHFFRMAEKYFAEIPPNSPVWEDILIPHARIIWRNHRDFAITRLNQEDFPENARELFSRCLPSAKPNPIKP